MSQCIHFLEGLLSRFLRKVHQPYDSKVLPARSAREIANLPQDSTSTYIILTPEVRSKPRITLSKLFITTRLPAGPLASALQCVAPLEHSASVLCGGVLSISVPDHSVPPTAGPEFISPSGPPQLFHLTAPVWPFIAYKQFSPRIVPISTVPSASIVAGA